MRREYIQKGWLTAEESKLANELLELCKKKPIRRIGPKTKKQIAAEAASYRKYRKERGMPP